jgi:NAD(P)-dependent dehydrogenase (short-subunit alcohol dehydrogenase family)
MSAPIINPMSLENKRILVTGASSGIGRAIAILCSKLGADIVLVGRNEKELNYTFNQLNEGTHLILQYDISIPENIESMMNQCIVNDGRKLNGLVHAAGINALMPLSSLGYKKMNEVMQINYFAFLELAKFFSKRKYSDGGSIVGISSVSSMAGSKGMSLYCGSKGALDSSIRALALELSPKNIRVNSVVPSYIKTDMYNEAEKLTGGNAQSKVSENQILGLGGPDDVANAVAFLLSDASKFITGSALVVDGGYLAQ